MFLIQTRKENNFRGVEDIIDSHGNAKDWSNYQHQFKDIEKAKKECELMISTGQYKARNIRIVEVVCTFDSEIKVSSHSKR
ncbi:hypothetical protein PJ311_18370 [Bacillus sp. CLL-7-23]|uniref:Uncharacterized protein n=1 Tax=Bacillus changyiensis TaxID=3004103 RepID=A0ABT4XAW0_9BACI|nr:hypothetical protein [Bacillus changyiensis]MDA1477285.1 hypothetical protein [Bacillus changyiensis]MDA7028507.1 hypothetical protein [Bacillus changyiensis]